MVLIGAPLAVARAADETLQGRLERMEQIIRQQQADLEAQRQQLADQYELIRQLQSEQQAEKAAASSTAMDTAAPAGDGGMDGQAAAVAELERREQEGEVTEVDTEVTLYDPSSSAYDPDFPGAWHLPGTTAAMKIGGYVNLAIVHNFDPLDSGDSFIVGRIPTEGTEDPEAQPGTIVSAEQTRLNIEVREQTSHGTLRAFVEGDFAGDGDTFRLRHAYGQYGAMLAGKTWSTFVNRDALPDEVDHEGTNGAILQRQSQLRFFPQLGNRNNLTFAIEDPTTDLQNGIGVKGNGDFIVSVDSLPLGDAYAWNYKVAVLYRDLKGRMFYEGSDGLEVLGENQSTNGWGITTSGRKSLPFGNSARYFQWQLTYGKGIGSYINDLSTVGGGDGVFDPEGELRALPVFAGFLSYNHDWESKPWFTKDWPGIFRSNVMFSWVDIDNYEFQADDSYNKTWRAATNLFYYPTQNVRLGAEFLWGKRINKDETKGSATQVQVSARYIF